MKVLVFLFCALSVFYQINGSPDGVDISLSGSDNEDGFVSRVNMNKRPRLWNHEEDIAQVYAVDEFWTKVFDRELSDAEALRSRKNLKITANDSSTVENISTLFADPETPLQTLDYLYQSFPQVITFPYYKNVFMSSSQEVLNHFYEHYSGDAALMERLLEACCFNSRLTLPDEFFAVDNPQVARKHIEIVRAKSPFGSDLLRKCCELPKCIYTSAPQKHFLSKAKTNRNTKSKGKLARKSSKPTK